MSSFPLLNPLRAFEAADRLKSIRKAAKELFVAPGAVSRQVQLLENHLGVKLFRREPRTVVLTAAIPSSPNIWVLTYSSMNWRSSWSAVFLLTRIASSQRASASS